MPEIRPGRYRHYKGNEHTVLGVARHSETLEGWISGPRLGRRNILHAVAFPEAAVAAKRRKPALGADAGAGKHDNSFMVTFRAGVSQHDTRRVIHMNVSEVSGRVGLSVS